MQTTLNLLDNIFFEDLSENIANIQGEFCRNWLVRSKGGVANTKHELAQTQAHDAPTLSLHLQENTGWFRIMQKLDFSTLKYKKLHFAMDCSISQNSEAAEISLDFIAILEVDSKGHAASHTKIFNTHAITPTTQHLSKLFELNPIKAGVEYYLCVQLSETCNIHFSGFSLTQFDPYENNTESQKIISGAIFAAEKKKNEVAPYKNYGFSYYAQLATLNSTMSSRAKIDMYGYLSEVIFVALRFEAYETAISLVRYLLALPTRMNEEQFKAAAPVIVATLQGVGEVDLLKQFLEHNLDIVCGNDELFASYSMIMFNEGNDDRRGITLPSGRTNAQLLHKLIGASNSRLGFTYDIMLQNNFPMAGEQSLMLANCYNPSKMDSYLNMVNNYLTRFSLPNIARLDFSGENILHDIEFEAVQAVEKPIKVTVIIAGFNCASTINYALKSILNQSYRNIEVLFCDDASNDDSLKMVQTFAHDERLKIYQSERNQGCYNIRNQLVELATGDFITFHDSDDYAIPTRIATQLEACLSKQTLLSLSRWVRLTPSGEFVFFKDHIALRMCVNSIMFRREIFATIGQYRNVLCGADSEFFEKARALFGDAKISHIKAPMVLGLWSDNSMTKSAGTEALDNGYRAPKRRVYAEAASRQRALGVALYSDDEIDAVNVASGIYRAPAEIMAYATPELINDKNIEKTKGKGLRKWLK